MWRDRCASVLFHGHARGLLVTEVLRDGPAAHVGLQSCAVELDSLGGAERLTVRVEQ